ncbi:hypothetical protein J6590_019800 [Homalodisca vitripennis]|nr:hypothetical protein J6590_019800 [Homalodisca vitripennis]
MRTTLTFEEPMFSEKKVGPLLSEVAFTENHLRECDVAGSVVSSCCGVARSPGNGMFRLQDQTTSGERRPIAPDPSVSHVSVLRSEASNCSMSHLSYIYCYVRKCLSYSCTLWRRLPGNESLSVDTSGTNIYIPDMNRALSINQLTTHEHLQTDSQHSQLAAIWARVSCCFYQLMLLATCRCAAGLVYSGI